MRIGERRGMIACAPRRMRVNTTRSELSAAQNTRSTSVKSGSILWDMRHLVAIGAIAEKEVIQ